MKSAIHDSPLVNIAVQAAIKAGDVLRKGFGTQFAISSKAHAQDLVTEYDKASEETIISFIRQQYPDHAFLAEESGLLDFEGALVRWIIDPLDGTMNFAHHIPLFAISIAALIDNEIEIGLIYNPLSNELFLAQRGKGAYMNGLPIHVSAIADMANAVSATGFPYGFSVSRLAQMINFLDIGNPVRILGSATLNLAYVASGRFEAYWATNLQPWDVAAGKLIIEEAGGTVTDFEGNTKNIWQQPSIIATNGLLHETFLSNLIT